MKQSIDLQIIGKDYTSFDDALFIVINKNELLSENNESDIDEKIDELYLVLKELIPLKEFSQSEVKHIKEDILLAFLEMEEKRFARKELIINNTESITGKNYSNKSYNDYHLFSKYNYKYRFDGVIGMISDDLRVPYSFFYDYTDLAKAGFNYINEDDFVLFHVDLLIKSRFDSYENPYFLTTLLFHDKLNLSESSVPNDDKEMYDYLILFWYKEQLKKAFSKGYYKRYTYFKKNDDHMKGCIDVARHIKENIGQNNGKIAYTYRENSFNNPLNHLIIAAYKELKRRFPALVEDNIESDLEFKKILTMIFSLNGDTIYETQQIIRDNQQPISHPYYSEYEELRKTCLKILRDEKGSLWADNNSRKSKGFLCYVPDLWECYLGYVFYEHLSESCIKDQDQIMVFESGDVYSASTYPDFYFGDPPYMILDAKFVPGWEKPLEIDENRKGGLGNNLGDYTKCIRDMNSLACFSTGVVFPTCKKPTDEKGYFTEKAIRHKISEFNSIDRFYTFPVVVPSDNENIIDYRTWLESFNDGIQLMIESVEKYLASEQLYFKMTETIRGQMIGIRNEM